MTARALTRRALFMTLPMLLAGAAFESSQVAAQNAAPAAVPDSASLDQRMQCFLQAARRHHLEGVASFFPAGGEFTYVHTVHRETGDSVATRRIPSRYARQYIVGGMLRPSFDIDHHGQPIGLFLHQLILRGSDWRRVSPTRFVPPRANASSPIFVEWRQEGEKWVVSAFGDERFTRQPFPDWCC